MSNHNTQSPLDDSSHSTNPYEVDPSQLLVASQAMTRVRLRTQVSKRSSIARNSVQQRSATKKAKSTQHLTNQRNEAQYDGEEFHQEQDDISIPASFTIGSCGENQHTDQSDDLSDPDDHHEPRTHRVPEPHPDPLPPTFQDTSDPYLTVIPESVDDDDNNDDDDDNDDYYYSLINEPSTSVALAANEIDNHEDEAVQQAHNAPIATGVQQCNMCELPSMDGLSPIVSGQVDNSFIDRLNAIKELKELSDFSELESLDKASLSLLQLLQKMKVPLYAFDSIFEWAHESATKHAYDFRKKPKKRKKFLKDLSGKLGIHQKQPVTKSITLPNTNVETQLTVVSIREAIYSLLSDPALMSEENLLFHGDSPLQPPPNPDDSTNHLYNDINSGTVFYQAWEKFCGPPGSKKVLLPLIFFIDKTFIDKKGKLNSEPVTFTLGIFKRIIRNTLNDAWRSIGFIPDAFLSGYHDPDDKAKDYHFILDLIFSELRDLQQSGGIAWKLQYKGTIHDVVFIPTIHLIITDTKAADDLVGKFQFRGTSVDRLPSRLCRFCDIPSKDVDDPVITYNLTHANDIQSLHLSGQHEALRNISYRNLSNAFWNLTLSDPCGINGCIPPDLLHVHLKGMNPYLRDGFFATLRLDAAERLEQQQSQRERETRRRRGSNNDDHTQANSILVRTLADDKLGEFRVFGKQVKKAFEALAWAIANDLRRQSDRTLPRVFFTQGVTQHFAKLSGTEETGVLLLILLCLCSTAGTTIFANERRKQSYMGVPRFSNWIGTIERFLQFEQWVKDVDTDITHTTDALESIEDYIPMLIERFKNTVDRKGGVGTKFVKLHLLRHHVEAHRKYGKLVNMDSSSGETRHKHFAKEPGKQTQRRKETFDKEVAQRNVDSVLLSLGLSALPNTKVNNRLEFISLPAPATPSGFLYVIDRSGYRKHPRSTCYLPPCDSRTHASVRDCLSHISSVLADQQATHGSGITLTTYHTLNLGQHIYHSCPNYKGKSWYDWAMVTDHHGTTRVMLLLLIFRNSTPSEHPIMFSDTCPVDVSKIDTYVVGLYLDGQETYWHSHEESEMLFSANLENSIQCIPANRIQSPIAVYPDYDFEDKRKLTGLTKTGAYCIIHPRYTWAKIFLDRANNDEVISA